MIHAENCPFADLEGGILTPSGECPCQTGNDLTLACMRQARDDLRAEETGRRRWIVNVPELGLVREAEAVDENEAAILVLEAAALTIGPDGVVCEVVPFADVIGAVLGQVRTARVEVKRSAVE